MAKVSAIQTAFNAGELSPLMAGRVDFDRYRQGLATCLNFLPLVQGGLTRRPGTRFVAETKDSGKAARLVRFEYSTTQAYILEFGDGYVRFYKDGGVIVDGDDPYEIESPYAEADLAGLRFAQSADVLFIAGRRYAPRKLSRRGHTDWFFTTYEGEWGPFLDRNTDRAKTITASGTTGTVTLTANFDVFQAGHVGALWGFNEIVASKYPTWLAGGSSSLVTYHALVGEKATYGGRVYEAQNEDDTGRRPPVHEEGTETDGAVNWTFVGEGFGYARITKVTDARHAEAEVVKTLPGSVTSGVWDWSEGAWSDYQGWPGAVRFYEGRLWWGGTVKSPQTLWASRSGDYANFKMHDPDGTVTDDAGLALQLDSADVNAVRWMADMEKALVVGTSGGEWLIRSGESGSPITPTSVRATRASTHGCADVAPIMAANAICYVQRAGRKVRELAYVWSEDGFRTPDLTVLAEHVTGAGVRELAYQPEPLPVVWCVLTDGTLAAMTYDREQKVVGWHRHVLGGGAVVESAAVIPASAGWHDELWLLARRTVDGETRRYVEVMAPPRRVGDAQAGSWFVDCGLRYFGDPEDTFVGLDHLEGLTVSILGDGAVYPDQQVVAGSVRISKPVSKAIVGLPYLSEARTLRIEAGAADGTAQGKTKRIHKLTARVLETLGTLWGDVPDSLSRPVFRTSVTPSDQAPALYSGDVEIPWRSDYNSEGQILARQDQPLPATILALMPQLLTQDG